MRDPPGDGPSVWRQGGAGAVDQRLVAKPVIDRSGGADDVPRSSQGNGSSLIKINCQGIEKAQPAKLVDLRPVQMFGSELRRIDRVTIDQTHVVAGPSEYRCGQGAADAAPDNHDVRGLASLR